MKNYYILKTYCSKIFLLGSGNFWYEDNVMGDDKSLFYRMYSCIMFFIYGFMTVLEIMAAVFGDFPSDEKRDSVTFAVSHTVVMLKICSVLLQKDLVKALNRKMVTICEHYEEQQLMSEKYRVMKINVVAYFVTVYGSAACFVFEGLRKVFEGSHFVTVVTYYPSYEDNSVIASTFRIFTTAILFIMLMNMIVSVDTYTMIYLIMYKYKIITLRQYFENLRKTFDELNEPGNEDVAAQKLSDGLAEGIQMHSQLLWLLKDIDKAFGTVMALQLCQSSGSAVSLLLQIALSDQLTFVAGMKIIFFVVALFLLLGLFLCNAGEITYQVNCTVGQDKVLHSMPRLHQLVDCIGTIRFLVTTRRKLHYLVQASLLSDAIFYSGWHACRPRVSSRNIRKIVLLAIMQAQRPLVMKAFKMLELTYGTFILVLRATYSVFALFYAQDK